MSDQRPPDGVPTPDLSMPSELPPLPGPGGVVRSFTALSEEADFELIDEEDELLGDDSESDLELDDTLMAELDAELTRLYPPPRPQASPSHLPTQGPFPMPPPPPPAPSTRPEDLGPLPLQLDQDALAEAMAALKAQYQAARAGAPLPPPPAPADDEELTRLLPPARNQALQGAPHLVVPLAEQRQADHEPTLEDSQTLGDALEFVHDISDDEELGLFDEGEELDLLDDASLSEPASAPPRPAGPARVVDLAEHLDDLEELLDDGTSSVEIEAMMEDLELLSDDDFSGAAPLTESELIEESLEDLLDDEDRN